jgi:hypothetical protein
MAERSDLKARIHKYSDELDRESVLARARGSKIASVQIDHPSEALIQAILEELHMTVVEEWRKQSDETKPEVWKGPLNILRMPERAVVAAWERTRNLKSKDVSGYLLSKRLYATKDRKTVLEVISLRRPRGIRGDEKAHVEKLDSMRLIHAEGGAYDSGGKSTREYAAFQKLDRPKSPDWLPIQVSPRRDKVPGLSDDVKQMMYENRRLPVSEPVPGPTPGLGMRENAEKIRAEKDQAEATGRLAQIREARRLREIALSTIPRRLADWCSRMGADLVTEYQVVDVTLMEPGVNYSPPSYEIFPEEPIGIPSRFKWIRVGLVSECDDLLFFATYVLETSSAERRFEVWLLERTENDPTWHHAGRFTADKAIYNTSCLARELRSPVRL